MWWRRAPQKQLSGLLSAAFIGRAKPTQPVHVPSVHAFWHWLSVLPVTWVESAVVLASSSSDQQTVLPPAGPGEGDASGEGEGPVQCAYGEHVVEQMAGASLQPASCFDGSEQYA